MIKYFFTLFTVLVSLLSFSQNNKATELYITGNSNFKAGKFREAITNYTKLMELVDENTVKKTCYINRGLSRDRIKEYDLAISDFTEAIKLDSTDMASFIDRGLSKMHAGYLEKAKEDSRLLGESPEKVFLFRELLLKEDELNKKNKDA